MRYSRGTPKWSGGNNTDTRNGTNTRYSKRRPQSLRLQMEDCKGKLLVGQAKPFRRSLQSFGDADAAAVCERICCTRVSRMGDADGVVVPAGLALSR
jgi:hypothetical protein